MELTEVEERRGMKASSCQGAHIWQQSSRALPLIIRGWRGLGWLLLVKQGIAGGLHLLWITSSGLSDSRDSEEELLSDFFFSKRAKLLGGLGIDTLLYFLGGRGGGGKRLHLLHQHLLHLYKGIFLENLTILQAKKITMKNWML